MSSVSINKQTRSEYSSKEERYIEIDEGYAVTQNISISSRDLPIVEKAYQKISSLYERGVDFNSNDLLYYYTKLNDLKMELLNNASIDAYSVLKPLLRAVTLLLVVFRRHQWVCSRL